MLSLSLRSARRHLLQWAIGAGAGLSILFVNAPAWAEEARPGVLVVLVDPGSTSLDPAEVRAAIARELRVDVVDAPVAGAAGTMSVKVEGTTELTMTFQSTDGWVEVTRQVALPADPSEQIETMALLAGNLARNEAGELLAGLKPKETPPPEETHPSPQQRTELRAKVIPPKAPPPPKPAEASACELARLKLTSPRPLHLSLWHPIALDRDSERHAYYLEFGLGYGRVGGISGGALNPLILRIEGPLVGAAVAGIYLDARGPACGAYLGGVGVRAQEELDGADVAGVFAWRDGPVDGVQAAGVITAARRVRGAQAAGALNLARGLLVGVQMSGVANFASGSVRGAQLAAAYNRSDDLDGIQIGLVNQAGRVRGVQIGLINVSRKVDGIALGLVNVVRDGRTEFVAWADGPARFNAGVKYLFDPVYTLVGAGYDLEPSTSASSAIGVEVPFRPFFGALDVMYSFVGDYWLRGIQEFHARHELRYRAMLGVELVPRWFGLFAGGAAEHGVDSNGRQLHFRPEGLAGIQVF
jgi:hypothetical protein